MELPKGERSILAYFADSESAQAAAQEVKNAGFDTGEGSVQVDRVSRYGKTNDASYDNPIGKALSQSALTIFSADASDLTDSERVLLSADPSVSGIGDTDYGVAGGSAFLLTVVTQAGHVDQTLDIIKRNGGNT
ncbi:MAG: hypothetical protein ACM3PP_06950 [Candidatus Saccharibacteria bacterium]